MGQPIAKQRFFIVGGAGFIGSHFCEALRQSIAAMIPDMQAGQP